MTRRSWASCAVLVLSGNLACAVASKSVAPPQPTSAPAASVPAPPSVVKDPTTGMELVYVKGGCYRMGNEGGGPEEKPAHEVCLADFYVGKYEVTQAQWKTVMGSNPSQHHGCDDCPVEMVSWNDAQAFLRALNDKGGGDPSKVYRLPTEAEWEYAARSGGKDERYAGRSDEVDSVAWYFWNAGDDPRFVSRGVGLKAPNGLGIHDMAGNVWEWTNDWYGESYYSSSPRDSPTGPISGVRRVLRGGSFANLAYDLRASYRNYLPPEYRGASKGFRVVKAAPLAIAPSSTPPPEHARALEATSASASPAPLFKDRTTGMEFVHVKGGCFRMGNIYDDPEAAEEAVGSEKPVHEVCLDDFYIGKYEVTQGQWKAIMRSNPSCPGNCPANDCPVDAVTWRDVELFIRRLNAKSGGGKYRLPTEAEWEYAARSGGKDERYSGGNDLDSVSWYDVTTSNRNPTDPENHPVGTKAPNGLGIYDMSGNVYEITSDWWDPTYYSRSPRNNPAGPASGERRVKRGGCVSGPPGNQRVARRSDWEDPSFMTGLRLVWTP